MPKGKKYEYDPKVCEYIMNHYKGVTTNELVDMIKRDLGIDETIIRVRAFKKRYKLNCGVDCTFQKGVPSHNKGKKMPPEIYEKLKPTMFKKGNRPHNAQPINSEKLICGYVYVKVNDSLYSKSSDRWRPKQHLIWEEHHKKKVPPKHFVIFGDGDKNNFDINNLILVTQQEMLYLMQNDLRYNDCELTKTGVLIAKVSLAAKDRSKNK